MNELASTFDGVLARFNEAFADRIVQVTGRRLVPADADFPCWAWPRHYGYTPQEESATWENVKADCTFWYNLQPYPETREVLQRLSRLVTEGHDVYFITSRPGVRAKEQTEAWLVEHWYGHSPTVLISSAKGLCAQALKLGLYVDDRWENAVDVASDHDINGWIPSGTETCLVDRPWNQDQDHQKYGIIRVASALDVLDQTFA